MCRAFSMIIQYLNNVAIGNFSSAATGEHAFEFFAQGLEAGNLFFDGHKLFLSVRFKTC